jgi:hypothetical protein
MQDDYIEEGLDWQDKLEKVKRKMKGIRSKQKKRKQG